MKTTLAALIILAVLGASQHALPAATFTYVFVPQNNPTKPDFDHDLAAGIITLKNDMGFFPDTPITFNVYSGIKFDPIVVDIEGTATATGLTITSAHYNGTSSTYFQTDEQITRDAEFDGTWVISTSIPDASTTLPLLLLSMIAFPVWWTFSRR